MDETGLIHMNGRVYDPQLARFIQADPFVQDAGNLQSLNRYSYVLNNPLATTDPTGYWGHKQQGYLRDVATIAIIVITQQYEMLSEWAGATAAEETAIIVAGGAAAGYVQTGNLKGAMLGGIESGIDFGIGQNVPYADNAAGNVGLHALSGGVMSVLRGGKFGHGFVTAGLQAAIDPHLDSSNAVVGTIEASITGGTLSRLTGGKFANGAMTAAFEYAFNAALHPGKDEAPVRQFSSDDITTSGSSSSLSKDDIASLKGGMVRAMNIFSDMVGRSGNEEMIGIVKNVKGLVLDLDDWNTKTFNGELLSRSTPAYASSMDQVITFSADRMMERDAMYSKVNVISHEFRHLTPYNSSIFVDYKKSPWGSNQAERDAEDYRREMMNKYWNTNRYMGN